MLSMLFYQSESDKILECSLYMYVNEKNAWEIKDYVKLLRFSF